MKHIRIVAVVLALVMALTCLSGCGASGKLAAKAGDRDVTVKELQTAYNNSSAYASYYGYPLDTAEGIEAFQDYLLDSQLTEQVSAYEAKLAGVTLTDEEAAEAKKTADDNYNSTYQTFVDNAEQSGTADVQAYAQKLFTEALVENGTTVGKLKKEMLQQAQDSILIEKHREQILAPVQLTDEELKAKFDEELAAQKTAIEADPSAYFTYESGSQYGSGAPILYTPAGLFRVKHILVEDEAAANDVKKMLDDGDDFDALLAEYGTDPGMTDNEQGYLIGEGASYVTEFLEGALALEKEGDISEPIQSSYGYHIIKRLGDEPAHEATYEEVKEAFDAYAQGAVDDETYNAAVESWLADESVVIRYPENYRFIGKDALEG